MSIVSTQVPDCDHCPFRTHLSYFGGTDGSANEIAALRKDVRTVAKRTDLYREGDLWDHLYILNKGWAFSYRVTNEGRRQIFNVFLPGDPVNVAALRQDRAPTTVQALTDLVVCVFNRNELDAYIHEDIHRTHQLEHYWLQALWAMKNSVLDLGRRTSSQRIAGFILGLEQRLRERSLAIEGTFEFPLRYRHVADVLGLTPVHVNRVISSLREQGIIELQHRTLSIRRLADLTALAR